MKLGDCVESKKKFHLIDGHIAGFLDDNEILVTHLRYVRNGLYVRYYDVYEKKDLALMGA